MTQAVVQAVAVIYLIHAAVFQAVENSILDSVSIQAVAVKYMIQAEFKQYNILYFIHAVVQAVAVIYLIHAAVFQAVEHSILD